MMKFAYTLLINEQTFSPQQVCDHPREESKWTSQRPTRVSHILLLSWIYRHSPAFIGCLENFLEVLTMSFDFVALSDFLKLFFDSVISNFECIKVFLRSFNEFQGIFTLSFLKKINDILIIQTESERSESFLKLFVELLKSVEQEQQVLELLVLLMTHLLHAMNAVLLQELFHENVDSACDI